MTVESASRDDDGGGVDTQTWFAEVGTDWWAVILVGVITVLAVADVLPKVPW